MEPASGIRLNLSWLMMSGAPNKLSVFGNDTLERLDSYQRLDASLSYKFQFQNSSVIDLRFSVYNLLDAENVLFRNFIFTFDETRSIPRLRPLPVDVLDLGIQPSFMIKFMF